MNSPWHGMPQGVSAGHLNQTSIVRGVWRLLVCAPGYRVRRDIFLPVYVYKGGKQEIRDPSTITVPG